MTDEYHICPQHGKSIRAMCPNCGKLLCGDCVRYYQGKCLCENCAPAITKEPAPPPAQTYKPLFYMLTVVGVLLLLGVSLAVYGLSRLGSNGILGGVNQMRMYRIAGALMDFKRDVGRYPSQQEGLTALVDKDVLSDEVKEGWYGPYLPKDDPQIFMDIFGNELLYGQIPEQGYYVHSRGADGVIAFDPLQFEQTKDEGDDLILLLGSGEVEGGEIAPEEELVFGKPVMKGGYFW